MDIQLSTSIIIKKTIYKVPGRMLHFGPKWIIYDQRFVIRKRILVTKIVFAAFYEKCFINVDYFSLISTTCLLPIGVR